jgi:hypothetical protein
MLTQPASQQIELWAIERLVEYLETRARTTLSSQYRRRD